MRNVVSISLPDSLIKIIKDGMKEGGFSTVSEFIRHLIRLWKTQKLVDDIDAAREEIKNGDYVELDSLKDLR